MKLVASADPIILTADTSFDLVADGPADLVAESQYEVDDGA